LLTVYLAKAIAAVAKATITTTRHPPGLGNPSRNSLPAFGPYKSRLCASGDNAVLPARLD
jgi:hypothetical protein